MLHSHVYFCNKEKQFQTGFFSGKLKNSYNTQYYEESLNLSGENEIEFDPYLHLFKNFKIVEQDNNEQFIATFTHEKFGLTGLIVSKKN